MSWLNFFKSQVTPSVQKKNPNKMERIDVHCHAVPAAYRQYALDNGHEKPDGMPALPVR